VVTGFDSIPGQNGDVAVRGHYAFVTNYDHGLYAIDVSNPSAPQQVGFYQAIIPYSITIGDSFAFVGGGEGGFEIYSIANASAMVREGYYHTFGGGSGIAVSQGRAYLADWTDFGIYDISAAIGLSTNPSFIPHPSSFILSCAPNPFNPTTQIRFDLPERSHVDLQVFDLQGRLVQTLASRFFPAGSHALSWDGTLFASGTYFARISTPQHATTQKLLLLK